MGKYFGTDGVRGVANEDLTLDMAVGSDSTWGGITEKNGSMPES